MIAFTWDGRLGAEELGKALGALLPGDIAIGTSGGRAGLEAPLCGAVSGIPLHRLERAAQPARERTALGVRDPLDVDAMERAGSVFIGRHDFCAFGATDRHRSGPSWGPGQAERPARDDRRQGRRLPASDGSAHGGRPPGGGPRTDGYRYGPLGTRRDRTGLRRGDRPGEGALPPARGPRATSRNERTENTRNDERKTYTVRESEIERRWYVVDATGETLGRLASRIAPVLEGKHKPLYQPNSTRAITSSCSTPRRSRSRATSSSPKIYSRHSGYPGGLQQETLGHLLARRPEEVIRRAVKGMLPHNRLGTQQLRKLKIYAGTEHPHEAQQPEPLA